MDVSWGIPTATQTIPRAYRDINEMIRAAAPDMLVDNTQTVAELPFAPPRFFGRFITTNRADRGTT